MISGRTCLVARDNIGASDKPLTTEVGNIVDAASETFGVRLELPNPAYRLPAGLKCKVRFGR